MMKTSGLIPDPIDWVDGWKEEAINAEIRQAQVKNQEAMEKVF